jgi:putative two-component system response regulator
MNERKKIILIVEDEEDLREFFQESLSSFGYEVFTSPNGKAALEFLKVGPSPDVIISDLMMPEMNGWDFAQALREDDMLKAIPLIVISALIDKSPPENSKCCVAKPFKLNELLETIEKHAA